jgi:hypothetical protein
MRKMNKNDHGPNSPKFKNIQASHNWEKNRTYPGSGILDSDEKGNAVGAWNVLV